MLNFSHFLEVKNAICRNLLDLDGLDALSKALYFPVLLFIIPNPVDTVSINAPHVTSLLPLI